MQKSLLYRRDQVQIWTTSSKDFVKISLRKLGDCLADGPFQGGMLARTVWVDGQLCSLETIESSKTARGKEFKGSFSVTNEPAVRGEALIVA